MSGGQSGSWAVAATVAKAVGRLHPAFRIIAVLAVACGAFALVLGVLGWMKPTTETITAGEDNGEQMTFSYTAEVPRSAAYDGTTVYSPQPIFRKLTDVVQLRMEYKGEPGQISASARLTSNAGWQSTMQLSQPKQFTASRYTHAVTLILSSFDERVRAASAAIGAELGQITVEIIVPVRHGDGSTFEPKLTLSISPLEMSLPKGPESLVVDQTSTAAGAIQRTRQISVFGHGLLTAAQARKYATYLLLVALAVVGVIAMIALRHAPLKTRSQIERRYRHLLVPVEPMPSPPGKPVVEIRNFPALVKLAEKYGQMILTWTRPDGADDFVVRDDGVTYRYRIVPADVTPEPQPEPRPASHRRPSARKATGVAKVAAPPTAAPPAEAPPSAPPTAETPPSPPPAAETPAPASAEEPDARPAEEHPEIRAEKPAQKPGEEPTAKAPQKVTEELPAEKPKPTQDAAPPPKPPAKRARRPRKKAEPAKPEPTPAEADNKPPLQRPIRLKPEAERKAMETLGELNKSVGDASTPEPEAPHEPIYDFLPKSQDQADGATGR